MFPDLSTVNTIAYDTETTGLDPHNDRPVGYVFTWGFRKEESVYLPIRHEDGGNLEEGPVIDFARRTLRRTDLRVVMHNAAFDLWMSDKDGIEINGPIEDTGLNDPLIEENQKGYSLFACCARARVQAKKGERMYAYLAERFGGKPTRDQMSNFWRLPGNDPMAVEYAEGDGTSTLQLWSWQQGQLDDQGLRRVWQVECDLIPVLHRARLRGVPIDVNELDRVHEQVKVMRADALKEIGGINPRAPSEVGPYVASIATGGKSDLIAPSVKKAEREAMIQEAWDTDIVPFPPRTAPTERFPNGQLSYSTAYLKSFSGGKKIVDVRKLAHLEDFSLVPLKTKHLHKGKVFPNFWQLASDDFGTVTGRLSSSGPNLQQVTKRNVALGVLYRRIFVPPEGMELWELDYSQCEYRLFAHFSQSEMLIKGYNEQGINMHKMVQNLLGFPDTLEGYSMSKNMNFGMLYGMGGNSLAGHLGVTLEEAKRLRATYLERIPEARQFMRLASNRAKTRGYIRTLLGRRRRYPNPVKQSYQAINSICQGGNADIVKLKMVEIDDYLRSTGWGHFAFSVHDAFVLYLDPARSKQAVAEIQKIGAEFTKERHGFELRCRQELESEYTGGANWAIASYGDKAA